MRQPPISPRQLGHCAHRHYKIRSDDAVGAEMLPQLRGQDCSSNRMGWCRYDPPASSCSVHVQLRLAQSIAGRNRWCRWGSGVGLSPAIAGEA